MPKSEKYIPGESYINLVEDLYNQLPLSYANELKRKFSAYPLEWQYRALTAENNYIIVNKPNITSKIIEKLDFNINRQNIANLITFGDAWIVMERLKKNFNRNILENPKICEFNEKVLDILMNIEDYDAFDKLAALGLEVDEESKSKLVRIYSQYKIERKEKAKAVVNKYLKDDKPEFNFR